MNEPRRIDGASNYQSLFKQPLPLTEHPAWVQRMIEELEPAWHAAAWPRLFRLTAEGKHPALARWRRTIIQLFPIVEAFPKYICNSLAKTTYGQRPGDYRVRQWFLRNLQVEARHAEWYLDWADGAGISREEMCANQPNAEVRALHEHLWTMTTTGSLAEGVAASNWAIEGITGVWTIGVTERFRAYASDGFAVTPRSMKWLEAHGQYDDEHPLEALEALKLYADGETAASVQTAAARSLALFERAIESCYDA